MTTAKQDFTPSAKARGAGRVALFVPEHELASLLYLNRMVPVLCGQAGGLQPLVVPIRHDNEQSPDVRTAAHPILRKRSFLHRRTIALIERFQDKHVVAGGTLDGFENLSMKMLAKRHSGMRLLAPIVPEYGDPKAPFGRVTCDIPVNGSSRTLKQALSQYNVRMIVSMRNYAYIASDLRRWARGEDINTGEPISGSNKLGGINGHPGSLMTSNGQSPGIQGLESPLSTYALGFSYLATTIHELRAGFDRGEIYGIVRKPIDEIDVLFDYPANDADRIAAEIIREINNRSTGDSRPGRDQSTLSWDNSTYNPELAVFAPAGERFAAGKNYFSIPDYTENGPHTVANPNSILEVIDGHLIANGKKLIDASATLHDLTAEFGGADRSKTRSELSGILNHAYYHDLLRSDPEIAALTSSQPKPVPLGGGAGATHIWREGFEANDLGPEAKHHLTFDKFDKFA